MSIIDPDGLFGGDRLRKCSNTARLYWPYLFLASNGFGRFEINYSKIVDRAFSGFAPVPAQHEIEKIILEYKSTYLLFLYESPDGSLWGQWDTRPSLLKKHKTASDKRSPVPDQEEFEKWQEEYRATKHRPVSQEFKAVLGLFKKNGDFSEKTPDFQKNEDFSAKKEDSEPMLENLPFGGGVGVGVGNGVGGGGGEKKSAHEKKTSRPLGRVEVLPDEISDNPPNDANELQCSLWFWERLNLAADSGTHRICSDSLKLYARELRLPVNRVAIEVLARAKLAIASGVTVDRFWFDGRHKRPDGGATNGKSGYDNRTKAQRDQDATIDAIAGAKEIFRRMVDRTAGNPGGEQGRAANAGASGS